MENEKLTIREQETFEDALSKIALNDIKCKQLIAILYKRKSLQEKDKSNEPKKEGYPRFVFNEFDNNKETIEVYTDGSGEDGNKLGCKGAWAYISFIDNNVVEKKSSAVNNTSVNRMELNATLEAIVKYQTQNIDIYTDSMYVWYSFNPKRLDTIMQEFETAVKDGETTFTKYPNIDLLVELYYALKQTRVRITWVRGHSGNPKNEMVDSLANSTLNESTITKDTTSQADQFSIALSIFNEHI